MKYFLSIILVFLSICLFADSEQKISCGFIDINNHGEIILPGSKNAETSAAGIRYSNNTVKYFTSGKIKKNKITCLTGDDISVIDIIKSEGKVIITQKTTTKELGLAGASFGLRIPDSYDVYIPYYSGSKWTKASPYERLKMSYPFEWEAQFIIIQNKDKNGYIIYADDNANFFKTLDFAHEEGEFTFSFETNTNAPFSDKKTLSSCPWIIKEYKGSWLEGANIYRRYADSKFNLAKLKTVQPTWVDNIEFIVTDYGFKDISALEEMAKRIDPKKTIVYIPDWRNFEYDVNYPVYTIRDGGLEYIKKLKAMGYKIMLHTNFFGISPSNPLYKEFEKYQLRDPYSNAKQMWPIPGKEIAYINPASKKWRELFVNTTKKMCEDYMIDGLYTDQTLVIMNDSNGIIDGMNMMQGSLALHKALREAMPNIALGGEGLNEISCRYESFAQRHPMGADFWTNTVNAAKSKLASPVSSSIFSITTRNIGYLGLPPLGQDELFKKWMQIYDNYGVMPTYPLYSKEDFSRYQALSDYIIEEANIAQKYSPRLDFTPNSWDKNDIMVYRIKDGYIKNIKDPKTGAKDLTLITGKKKEKLLTTITGVTDFNTDRDIKDTLFYNEKKVFNLNPESTYFISKEKREINKTHISDIYGNTDNIKLNIIGDYFTKIYSEPKTISIADLVNVEAGEYYWETKEYNTVKGLGVTTQHQATIELVGKDINIHPPFLKDGQIVSSAIGDAIINFYLTLPNENCYFKGNTALRTEEAQKNSDGVIYTVSASEINSTNSISNQSIAKTVTGEDLILDMSPLKGKKIILKITVNPGVKNNISFDQSVIRDPKIITEASHGFQLDYYTPDNLDTIYSSDSNAVIKKTSNNIYNIKSNSNVIYLIKDTPEKINLNTNIHENWIRYQIDNGKPSMSSIVSKENLTDYKGILAFNAHPAEAGINSYSKYILLPPNAKSINFSYIVKDEAFNKTNGVEFDAIINGKDIKLKKLIGKEGWQEATIPVIEFAGKPVFLEIITNNMGNAYFDWALIGNIHIK